MSAAEKIALRQLERAQNEREKHRRAAVMWDQAADDYDASGRFRSGHEARKRAAGHGSRARKAARTMYRKAVALALCEATR